MSSDSELEIELNNLDDDTIINKYKVAAEITHRILKELIQKCEPGASIFKLCEFGDDRIAQEIAKIYKKDKEMKKGVAYPTCIMRNNIVCSFSPLTEVAEDAMQDGDIIKIQLGVHVDGYAAIVAHTIVLGASSSNKVTGRKADVILAAHNCAEAALRLIKPDRESKNFTEALNGIAGDFGCRIIENCVTNGHQKDIYDTVKTFLVNPSEERKKDSENVKFEVNQVWTIDILVTSGDGKVKERDAKTTIFKKNLSADVYNLKLKASRQFFSDISNKYMSYPFTMRVFSEQSKAKIAVNECVNHSLIDQLPIMYEKDGEFVAEFKFTVLLTKNGPMKLTGLPMDNSLYKSEFKVKHPLAKSLLAEPMKTKKKVTTEGDS